MKELLTYVVMLDLLIVAQVKLRDNADRIKEPKCLKKEYQQDATI